MRSYPITGLVLILTLLWPAAGARADWCSGQNWLGQKLERVDRIAEGLLEMKTESEATRQAATQARQEAQEGFKGLADQVEAAAVTLDQKNAALCRQAKKSDFKEADFEGVILTGKAEIRAQLRLNLDAIERYRAAAELLKTQAQERLALADKLEARLAELAVLTRHLTRLKEEKPRELDQELWTTIQSACQVVEGARGLREGFKPLPREELLSQALAQAEAGLEKSEAGPDLEIFLPGCALVEEPGEKGKPEKAKKPWYKFW